MTMQESEAINQKPNLFVVGAPKCGTTSLVRYLGEHPQVYVAAVKEPNYWAPEFASVAKRHGIKSIDQYESLFSDAKPLHTVICEATTNYLYSETAISRIIKYNPRAKFIAMIRNPIEVVQALHNTLLYSLNETEPDFEKAWHLQKIRSSGGCIPATCLAPQYLQYREMASFASQLVRFHATVEEQNRRVIIFDDFKRFTADEHQTTLQFLCLPNVGQTSFPAANRSKQARFKFVHNFLRRPPNFIERPVARFRRTLFANRSAPVQFAKSLFRVAKERKPLRPQFRHELTESFSHEIDSLSRILDRDLSHWKGTSQ